MRQYTTTIGHIQGSENNVADALSRFNTVNLPTVDSTADIVEAQKKDTELQTILQSNTVLQLKRLRVDNSEDTIYCDISTTEIRPYIPQSFRRRIFDVVHCSHPSGRVTKKLIQQRFVWPSMSRDITNWARTCLACQKGKISRYVHTAPKHIPIPAARFQHIHIDIVGPLPTSDGYNYCLTMIDRFSRWPEAAPIASTTADDVVNAI